MKDMDASSFLGCLGVKKELPVDAPRELCRRLRPPGQQRVAATLVPAAPVCNDRSLPKEAVIIDV